MKKKNLIIPIFLAGMALPLLSQHQEVKADALFIGKYTDRTAYIKHGEEVNGQFADEGFTLLKNDGTFPLAPGAKISVFGKGSNEISRGGAGSGAASPDSSVTQWNFHKSLTTVGYETNPTLKAFYASSSKSGNGATNGNDGWAGNSEVTIGETALSKLENEAGLYDTFDEYSDLAIQVISRTGSEGCDILTIDATDSTKFGSSEKHALELSDNEQDLFDMLCEKFDKVLIVINSSNIFECDQFVKNDSVAGILWIGNPGDVGMGAVGRILSGEVNPSGRTVDTWTRDFTQDPVWQNFSDNRHTNVAITTTNRLKHASQDTMFAADGAPMMSFGTDLNYKDHNSPRWLEKDTKVVKGGINGVKPAAYVSYEEGIYVDYRYHETRYADMAKVDKGAADDWYNGDEGVVFPFGYGLSYTTFTQKIKRISPAVSDVIDENSDLVEVSVEVKNTGDVAGKDAVQIYWKAPYINGEIEKADHVLCAFGKSKMLEPGESQLMHLTFHLQDVANYDFSDANHNGFQGYELDGGEYGVMLMKNAHEAYEEVKLQVTQNGIQYQNDRFSGNEVKNRFTDRGFQNSCPENGELEFTQFSRADFEGTFPTHPTFETRTVSADCRYEEFLTHEFTLADVDVIKDSGYKPEEVYKSKDDAIAGGWSQQTTALAKGSRKQLNEMADVDLDDPAWDDFMNEMTYSEMLKYAESNGMRSISQNNIGKSGGSEGDGPQKFSIIFWVSLPIQAATFNQELAHEQGECVGCESHLSQKDGWWGPGCNTHRSPFGGRNFEYYCADPFLMGRMCAQLVGAATDRGVYCYFKHFAVNDQEKNRESCITWVNEQALREIYLKSFQMVFEEGKSIGVMASYNRLGLQETAGSYPLLTEVLRGEWGFKGAVLSDMTHSNNDSVNFKCYENVTNRVLAGCNCQLDSNGFSGQVDAKWDSTAFDGKGCPTFTYKGTKYESYSWWYALRQAVKEHLYMCVNSTMQFEKLTTVGGEQEAEVKVGEQINLQAEIEGKTVTSYELNKRVELPEGLELSEDGALTGTIDHVGLFRIDVIAHCDDGTDMGYQFIIRTTPDMSNTGLDGGNGGGGTANANMTGLIIGCSAGAVVVAAAVVILIVVLKKKKVA